MSLVSTLKSLIAMFFRHLSELPSAAEADLSQQDLRHHELQHYIRIVRFFLIC